MVCDLSKNELILLNHLVVHKCFSADHSKSEKALKHYLDYVMDTEEVLKSLVEKGYLGTKKKDKTNYWAFSGPTIRALAAHGYRIPRSGKVSL